MKFNALEISSLCAKYYFKKNNYTPFNDPNFTYQELVLCINSRNMVGCEGDILDTDELVNCEEEWLECISHYTLPMVIDKDWDKVLVDRSHNSPPNLKYDKNGKPLYWYFLPEYAEKFKKDKEEFELHFEENAKKRIKEDKIKMKEKNSFGNKLKNARIDKNLTLKELSELSGVLPQLISDYENNRKEPGAKNIINLCRALKITTDYLLTDEMDNYHNSKTNTYGEVLKDYLNALNLSKKDKLIIDKDCMKVSIEINNDYIKKSFIQLKDFLDMNNDMSEAMKNFNINLLSQIEIEDKEK